MPEGQRACMVNFALSLLAVQSFDDEEGSAACAHSGDENPCSNYGRLLSFFSARSLYLVYIICTAIIISGINLGGNAQYAISKLNSHNLLFDTVCDTPVLHFLHNLRNFVQLLRMRANTSRTSR